jgi:C-terminal processing protease CtpA/Prc
MVGRLRPDGQTKKDRLLVEGSGTAKTFNALLDDLAKKHDFVMKKQASGYGPSDHDSFYSKKIPVIFYWTGDHPDYHKPTDTADKINVAGMRKIVELTEDTVDYLAAVQPRPEYVELPRPMRPSGRGPRLGIRPAYGEDVQGVLVGGVTPGTPAGKAGIKEGDLIVEIGGRQVRSLEGYMSLMGNFRVGDTVDVTVLRNGQRTTLKVKLE